MVRELRVDSFYTRLRAATACSSPLLILPSAADVDSLCAVRVLAHVLAADSVRFSVYPVASAAAASELLASFPADQPLCLLLVNWGARRDLCAVLPPAATAFVVDSRRPVHFRNLCAANHRFVVLLTAEDERTADLAYDFDVSALADADGDYGDAHPRSVDEDSSDSDSSESDSGGRRKRRRLSDEHDPARLFGKLRRECYRLGTFHGKPSGCLMYDVAHALRRDDFERRNLSLINRPISK